MAHYFILVIRNYYHLGIIIISFWLLTCETLVKPTCVEARHKTHSLYEEAEECQAELDDMLKGFKTGDAMRGRVDGFLQAKLKDLQAQIAENNNGRQKIQAMTSNKGGHLHV